MSFIDAYHIDTDKKCFADKAGDFLLTPARYLFRGKRVTQIHVEGATKPTYHVSRGSNDFCTNILCIIVLVPTLFLGGCFKLMASYSRDSSYTDHVREINDHIKQLKLKKTELLRSVKAIDDKLTTKGCPKSSIYGYLLKLKFQMLLQHNPTLNEKRYQCMLLPSTSLPIKELEKVLQTINEISNNHTPEVEALRSKINEIRELKEAIEEHIQAIKDYVATLPCFIQDNSQEYDNKEIGIRISDTSKTCHDLKCTIYNRNHDTFPALSDETLFTFDKPQKKLQEIRRNQAALKIQYWLMKKTGKLKPEELFVDISAKHLKHDTKKHKKSPAMTDKTVSPPTHRKTPVHQEQPTEKKHAKTALLLLPKHDHNGAFEKKTALANTLRKYGYNVVSVRVGCVSEMEQIIENVAKKYGKLDFLQIGGHGTPNTITLGDDRTLGAIATRISKISDHDLFFLRNVKLGGTIFLDSCSTGGTTEIEENIATYIARNAQYRRVVFSPIIAYNYDVRAKEVTLHDGNKIIVPYFYNTPFLGKGKTYSREMIVGLRTQVVI